MTATSGPELVLIRHAAAATDGRLVGRTDVPASAEGLASASVLARALPQPAYLVTSPSLRCRQTAVALWPSWPATTDPRLAEQNFGDWDGLPHAEVPDLGLLAGDALAASRPPQGESFVDLYARACPALMEHSHRPGPVVVVAHAGTVRAALALALGSPAAALAFEVEPLSVTRLRRVSGDGFAITCVNCRA